MRDPVGCRSGQRESCGAQHSGQRDQRKPDQGGGIDALDAFEQGDAEALGLEAAGAVERLLGGHVACDLVRIEHAEDHAREVGCGLQARLVAARVDQAYGGVEQQLASRAGGELGTRRLRRTRLADGEPVQFGDLVAADDERARVAQETEQVEAEWLELSEQIEQAGG